MGPSAAAKVRQGRVTNVWGMLAFARELIAGVVIFVGVPLLVG